MSAWDEQSIKALLDKKDVAVLRAIVAIHRNQTADEKSGKVTRHTNGIGFSKFDAEFMSSLAEQIAIRGTLTPKQMAIGRNKIKRYWRQLVAIANTSYVSPPVVNTNAEPETPEVRDASRCDCENFDGEDICGYCKSIRSGYRGDW